MTVNASDSAVTDMAPHLVLVSRRSAVESAGLDEVVGHREQRVGMIVEDMLAGREKMTEEDIQFDGSQTPILGFLLSSGTYSHHLHHVSRHHVSSPSRFASIMFHRILMALNHQPCALSF